MMNVTTIGAGLGRSPSALLAWGLGVMDGVTTVTPIYSILSTTKHYLSPGLVTRI